jgi:CHAD domain-containing protein
LPAEPRTAGRRDGLTAHLRASVDAQLRVLLVEQVTAGQADEPESVHQMRVAARRMRVVLRMDHGGFGPGATWLRDELSWLGSLLGEVRDLDVLCERLAENATTLPEVDLVAFGDVLAALLARRSAAAGTLVAELGRPRFRALLRRLAAEAVAPLDPADDYLPSADDLLARPLRRLHRQLAVVAATPSDEHWHDLRIRVKRVRYAAELAGRLAGRKQRAELVALVGQTKAVQEVLGAFNDTVVAEHHLRQLIVTSPRELSPAGWLALGRLVERQVARRDALRDELPAAAGDLYSLTSA